jgi:hypothetical protein
LDRQAGADATLRWFNRYLDEGKSVSLLKAQLALAGTRALPKPEQVTDGHRRGSDEPISRRRSASKRRSFSRRLTTELRSLSILLPSGMSVCLPIPTP